MKLFATFFKMMAFQRSDVLTFTMIILRFSMKGNRKNEILSKKYQSNFLTILIMAEALKKKKQNRIFVEKEKQKKASQKRFWLAAIH